MRLVLSEKALDNISHIAASQAAIRASACDVKLMRIPINCSVIAMCVTDLEKLEQEWRVSGELLMLSKNIK